MYIHVAIQVLFDCKYLHLYQCAFIVVHSIFNAVIHSYLSFFIHKSNFLSEIRIIYKYTIVYNKDYVLFSHRYYISISTVCILILYADELYSIHVAKHYSFEMNEVQYHQQHTYIIQVLSTLLLDSALYCTPSDINSFINYTAFQYNYRQVPCLYWSEYYRPVASVIYHVVNMSYFKDIGNVKLKTRSSPLLSCIAAQHTHQAYIPYNHVLM